MATEQKATRTRSFSRMYDYQAKAVTIKAEDGTSATVKLADLPEAMIHAFAIGAFADYIVQAGNDAVKEGTTPTEAFKVMAQAAEKATKGEIEFRAGGATGESLGVCILVGRALVELGKSALTFKGVRHEFATAEEAATVCRALYDDAKEDAKDPTTKLTGRQFFSQLKVMPAIAEKLASYKPKAGSAVASALE